MSHHLIDGKFKSDKYPDLAPDKIVVSFKHAEAWPALAALAEGYDERDPELADDIRTRLQSIKNEIDRSADDDFHCETCSGAIRAGDKYTVTTDGCYLCEAHAPTYRDCVEYWTDHPPEDDEERENADDCRASLDAHVAAGGSPDDRPLTVMS
jgi:hypothetical protein